MSKIKKALKKLGLSRAAGASTRPSKAKSVAAKTPAKPAAKKVVKAATVKGGPAKKAAPSKAPAKAAPAKAAPVKGKPAAKAPIKPAAKAPVKAAPVKAAASKTPAAKPAPVKAAPPAKAPPKAEAKKTPTPAPEETSVPKAAKAKKTREEAQPEPEEEVVLLDAEGRRYCRVRECDQASAVDGYCRYHYLLYWKNIQVRKTILSEGKLERYIEDLTARYPDKYLEMLKKDLRTEKDFMSAIQELEIDESSVDNEYEDEAQNYLDEVRGMSSETGSNDRDEEF